MIAMQAVSRPVGPTSPASGHRAANAATASQAIAASAPPRHSRFHDGLASVNAQEIRAGSRHLRDGALDRFANVVKLQIQEHAKAVGLEAADKIHSRAGVQFQADLIKGSRIAQRADQRRERVAEILVFAATESVPAHHDPRPECRIVAVQFSQRLAFLRRQELRDRRMTGCVEIAGDPAPVDGCDPPPHVRIERLRERCRHRCVSLRFLA
jgi:hypothetical protein